MTDDFGEVETIRKGSVVQPSPRPAPSGPRLLLLGPGRSETFALPASGELVIGRAPGSQIRIDDPAISRKHAVIRVGRTLQIEDLESANGTRVHNARLQPGQTVDLFPGDAVELDPYTLILQAPSRSTERLRRLLPHGYFEAHLESECARAERYASVLALARIQVGAKIDPAQVQEIFASELRSDEAAAAYGPGEFEFLMVDTSPERAREVADRIAQQIHSATGVKIKLGLALYPEDGRTPEALLAKANDLVRGVRPASRGARQVVISAPAMQSLERLINRVARGSISVLILGETGVGKEVVAELIHLRSNRSQLPFVRLNCAALSESLIDSELFGHEKGAFTGAIREKPGLLETAEGGTLFLDEVGELPLATQVKLLRVLEERMVLRVGGLKPRPIDVRIVSATNRNLAQEIQKGGFRQDLYFRLDGISLTVPALRERSDEISALAELFVAQACDQDRRAKRPAISKEALAWLFGYSWPGNIRELKNVIERAVLLAGEEEITPEHLPLEKMNAFTAQPAAQAAITLRTPMPAPLALPIEADSEETTSRAEGGQLQADLEAFERDRIIAALERCGGNQTQAARMLGIARRTLIKRLDQYQISRPRKGRT